MASNGIRLRSPSLGPSTCSPFLPPPPELAPLPALLLGVHLRAHLQAALELVADEPLVAIEAGVVVAEEAVGDGVRSEDSGAEGLEDSLRREGVGARGGVADGEPGGARRRGVGGRGGGGECAPGALR